MSKALPNRTVLVESAVAAILALGLYLPFLAVQYDTNGIAEAVALESGQLIHKNHMLYRPIGFVAYHALQHLGYTGNSLTVLQVINALCGAAGIGLAYALFRWATGETGAAAIGAFWLATSFAYWLFSTDAAYITMAAMFACGAIVSVVYSQSWRGVLLASLLTSLSILTWQASMFIVPAVVLLFVAPAMRSVARPILIFAAGIVAISGFAYIFTAVESHGWMGMKELWTWLTSYVEKATLPMWGAWSSGRIGSASVSAVRSVLPTALAALPGQITPRVQLGRVAIDIAIIGFVVLLILAIVKMRLVSMYFILCYALFIPFIVWWDPFEPKWFVIPNVFLAGFLSCGLQAWLPQKRVRLISLCCLIAIAAANFVTTIRPRHNQLGPERAMAQCVAEHMKASDAFMATDWGWPDYLNYLYGRTAVNLINETASEGSKERMLPVVKSFITSRQQQGGVVYMTDPGSDSAVHLEWLRNQTGLTVDELLAFRGESAFNCYGRVVHRVSL